MRELPIPIPAESAAQAVELARIWAADGSQHVSLNTKLWEDPGAWGLMLVDLAHHIARAYEQVGSTSQAQALARIKEAFEAEWSAPTDEPTGHLEE